MAEINLNVSERDSSVDMFVDAQVHMGSEVTKAYVDAGDAVSVQAAKDYANEQVPSVVAAYVTTHKDELKGERGLPGEPGQPGQPGSDGQPGKDGAAGSDGYTPVKGVDYFTDDDVARITAAAVANMPTVPMVVTFDDGTTATYAIYGAVYD